MREHDFIAGWTLLIVAGALFYIISDAPADAAFFPVAVLAIVGVLSAVLIIRSWPRSISHVEDTPQQSDALAVAKPFLINPRRFVIGITTTAGYVSAIVPLGFYTASALFVVAASILLGERRYWIVLVAASAFVALSYLIFGVLFERPLPKEFFLSLSPVPAEYKRHG